jgi:hypothetical protein
VKQTITRILFFGLACIAFIVPRPARSQTTSFDVETTSDNLHILKTIALPNYRLGVLACNDYAVNIYLKIYNSSGVQTNIIDITSRFNWPHTTHDMVEMNAVATDAGNIFIGYAAASNSTGIQTYNARYILLSDDGSPLSSGQLNSTDAGGSYIWKIQLDKLSDGKIMAVWRKMSNSTIVFRLFNADGSAAGTDQPFAGPGTANNITSSIYTVKAAAGKTGHFMVSLFYYNGYVRGFSFDNAGNNAVSGGQSSFAIDPTLDNNCDVQALIALANGNFVACWWLSGVYYIKVVAADGSTVVAKQSMPHADIATILPVYTPGAEGFIYTRNIPQDPDDDTNPYSTMWLYSYNQTGVLQSSTAAAEGALIQPSYTFTSGSSSGFAYLYSYYKSYSVMGFPFPGYSPDGDTDIKGSLNAFSLSTLPVSLISFNGVLLSNQTVQLTWKTAGETNNSHFEVEKSMDARNFKFTGRVTGKNTSEITGYSFTDQTGITQNTWYRLKQVDKDGKEKMLGTKLLKFSGTPKAAGAYPNPVLGNQITVSTGDEPLPAFYKLTDMQGKTIKTGVLHQTTQQLDVHNLNRGMYLLYIGAGQVIKISKD